MLKVAQYVFKYMQKVKSKPLSYSASNYLNLFFSFRFRPYSSRPKLDQLFTTNNTFTYIFKCYIYKIKYYVCQRWCGWIMF